MEDRLHHRAGRDPGAPRPSLTGPVPIPHHPATPRPTPARSACTKTPPDVPAGTSTPHQSQPTGSQPPPTHSHTAHNPARALTNRKSASETSRIGGSRLSSVGAGFRSGWCTSTTPHERQGGVESRQARRSARAVRRLVGTSQAATRTRPVADGPGHRPGCCPSASRSISFRYGRARDLRVPRPLGVREPSGRIGHALGIQTRIEIKDSQLECRDSDREQHASMRQLSGGR